MRTTVTIDDELVAEAKIISGMQKTSPLINKVLEEFVRRENQQRLAKLGGSEPHLRLVPRKRFP